MAVTVIEKEKYMTPEQKDQLHLKKLVDTVITYGTAYYGADDGEKSSEMLEKYHEAKVRVSEVNRAVGDIMSTHWFYSKNIFDLYNEEIYRIIDMVCRTKLLDAHDAYWRTAVIKETKHENKES